MKIYGRGNIKNQKGMMLIWFYLLITILIITGGSLFGLAFQESRLIAIDQSRDKAFYLAEAGLDRKLKELKEGNTTNILGVSFGEGNYTVYYCPTVTDEDEVTAPCQLNKPPQIIATGAVNGISKTTVAVVSKIIPPGVKGAMTSEGNMSFNGSITVDGRDYDSNGNLTGDPGTYGASSGGTVTGSTSSVASSRA